MNGKKTTQTAMAFPHNFLNFRVPKNFNHEKNTLNRHAACSSCAACS
jgi:hypothetical protein